MSKFKTTLPFLIQDIDTQNFNQAAKRLSYIKTHIKAAANYEIILKITAGNHTQYNLYLTDGFKSNLITNMESFHNCGVISRPAITNYGELLEIIHMKTTLFNALLIIPGAEIIAEKMMEMDQKWTFNSIRTDYTQTLTLVMNPEKGKKYTKIAEKLVDRGGFHLDDFSLDKVSGKKQTILEDIVASKNYELFSYMTQNGNYNFNSEYAIYSFPITNFITPLMLFAYFGDFQGVKMLVESGVDINHIISAKTSYKLNALSFAGNNMEIAEYLIERNCEFLDTTIGLTQSLLYSGKDNFLDNMVSYHENISKLLADRAYYQAATSLLKEVDKHTQSEALNKVEKFGEDRKAVYKKFDTEESVSLETQQPEDKDLETLLLRYSITKNEEIADHIRTLCLESGEAALKLVSILLKDGYLTNSDTALVGNLICDPLLINQYFEQRKALTKAKMHAINLQLDEQEQSNWQTHEGFISIKGVIPVKTSMNCNVYIKIDDDLSSSVGNYGLSNLRILPKADLGRNGIKFRDDLGIITLKTKGLGNNRLVAEGIYKNKSGDILIYFKYLCNHEGVENWLQENPYSVDGIFITDKINEDTEVLGEDTESNLDQQ